MIGFSTPFDGTAVDFLESLKVPCYKIAAFENIDIPLIRRVAATGKPMPISTGLATKQEIREAVEAARKAGCREIILLKCTSAYPAEPEDANLRTISGLAKEFNCQVGLSDHTQGLATPIASVALGATVIEKHFTLSRKEGGVDATFSLEPEEMRQLVQEIQKAWQALGDVKYGPTKQEKKSLIFRRSLYVVKDIKAGEHFTADNIRAIRPGLGLSPKYYYKILCKRARIDIKRGTPVRKEQIL